jgi:general secretion pathway protein G
MKREYNTCDHRLRISSQRAYTMIEILAVLAVIGSLAAIAIQSFQAYVEKSKISRTIMEISGIAASLNHYREDNRQFPPSLSVIFSTVPVDPWGNPYQYLAIDITPSPNKGAVRKDKNLNPLNSDFDLYSMGKDGQTVKPLTGAKARDDIVRAGNGGFIGLATDH